MHSHVSDQDKQEITDKDWFERRDAARFTL